MAYTVKVEWAPAYEVYAAAATYVDSRGAKVVRESMDVGSDWYREVRSTVGPDFDRMVDCLGRLPAFPLLQLVRACPDKDSGEAVLKWLTSLSDGQVYEYVVDYVQANDTKTLKQLSELRHQYEWVFARWIERYQGDRDPEILALLRESCAFQQRLLKEMDGTSVVESATNGMRQEERDGLSEVILIPQFHYRPRNLYHSSPKSVIIMYPVEAPAADSAQPPEALVRLTRALGDETRLRILKYLSGGVRSFSDVAVTMDMSKATVHYHMMLLRAAGLIRTHVNGVGREYDRYSLRSERFAELGRSLTSYIVES